MKYYRVKKETFDNITGLTAIKNELITEVERKRLFPSLRNSIFEEVNVSKNNVFFSLGCRFEIK